MTRVVDDPAPPAAPAPQASPRPTAEEIRTRSSEEAERAMTEAEEAMRQHERSVTDGPSLARFKDAVERAQRLVRRAAAAHENGRRGTPDPPK